jgi:hypothetical protein
VLEAEVMAAYEESILLGASPFRSFRKTLHEARRHHHRDHDRIRAGRFEVGISLILGGTSVDSAAP